MFTVRMNPQARRLAIDSRRSRDPVRVILA